MPEPLFTRCPDCRTTFRVRPEQLAARGGQVRCGVCRCVFDAEAHGVDVPRRILDSAVIPLDEGAQGPETMTLGAALPRQVSAPEAEAPPQAGPPPPAAWPGEPAPPAEHEAGARSPSAEASEASTEVPTGAPGLAPEESSGKGVFPDAARPIRRPSRARQVAGWTTAVLLLLLLSAQAAWHYRHLMAAHFPQVRPWLERMCEHLGCTIDPVADLARLSIESSDLQADPAHQGLLILTALLRNQGAFEVAPPHLELTVTDAQDKVLARKVLSPGEYAPTISATKGFPPESELPVKLFLDGSTLAPGGYRLALFYP